LRCQQQLGVDPRDCIRCIRLDTDNAVASFLDIARLPNGVFQRVRLAMVDAGGRHSSGLGEQTAEMTKPSAYFHGFAKCAYRGVRPPSFDPHPGTNMQRLGFLRRRWHIVWPACRMRFVTSLELSKVVLR